MTRWSGSPLAGLRSGEQANASEYGLNASLWTRDTDLGHRVHAVVEVDAASSVTAAGLAEFLADALHAPELGLLLIAQVVFDALARNVGIDGRTAAAARLDHRRLRHGGGKSRLRGAADW